MKELTSDMIDTLLGVANDIEIDGRKFTAGRATLGKMFLLQRAIKRIHPDITFEEGETNALYTMAGLMQLANNAERADDIYRIVALQLSNTRHELLNASYQEETKEYLKAHLTPTEVCTLFLNLKTFEDVSKYQDELGITTELMRMERVSKVKEAGGSVSFCGCSLWGTLIDQAAERYGWTLDYILWGITFANLQMLLADHPKTMYLTEKERKQAHVSTDRKRIDGNDKTAMAQFAAELKQKEQN